MSNAKTGQGEDTRARGVTSLNQDYRRYEQVDKNQASGLSENPDADRFDDELEVLSSPGEPKYPPIRDEDLQNRVIAMNRARFSSSPGRPE